MWIKVCGIRDLETARAVADLGIDAIGLNFYSRSPRSVSIDDATAISQALPQEIARVGVFVNHSLAEITSIATSCRLDLVQLHGDEPASFLVELARKLPEVRLVRAWRMSADGLGELISLLEVCSREQVRLAGCLVDAHVTGLYGGSGKTVPWQRLAEEYSQETFPPLILAGGLTPDNIAQAISAVRPWGVDVASGVESAPGVKDIELAKRFVTNARTAVAAG
ncbi:N-(5'-phosphoribosyl)anthranilate isomerase [Schlesneria sp. T3-172]|uniref:phosphoribosylanthranilate isomerase n=1 Tax=Schlesneria sphaerica TaxID=3373610 RepID=UPI0037C997D5